MSMTLFELAGTDPALVFSPYCWRIRFALHHKGLAFRSEPWRFTETEKLTFSGQGRVPVLVDGETVVSDSWAIARYLDATYPAAPLGAGPHLRFLNAWADTVLQPAIARLIVRDILDVIPDFARPYFRQSRERAFGMTLEAVIEGREDRRQGFHTVLTPIRTVLKTQQFLGGEAPDYADYIVAGSLMWARCSSPFQILLDDDPVGHWFQNIRQMFGGMAEKAPTP
jgi:glutathione S-transferase